MGGTRYRVEYSDSLVPLNIQSVVRPLAEEVDPAGYGIPSVATFTHAFTNAPPAGSYEFRLYRIRVLNE